MAAFLFKMIPIAQNEITLTKPHNKEQKRNHK